MSQQGTPMVSVIIATRDRPAVLEQCLQHLEMQKGEFSEIIIVDNSVDQQSTLAAIERCSGTVYLRADPAKRNPAMMRNMGIQASRGEIQAFIDDDTLVSHGWLNALIGAFTDPQVGGITGRVIEAGLPEVDTPEIGRFTVRGEITMNFNSTIDHLVPVEFLYGCNMAVRRSTLDSVGYYDAWFGFAYEEQDVSFRIRRAGFQTLFVPNMVARHLKAARPTGVARRSSEFDPRSLYLSCRSLAYLCVGHFGLKQGFWRVAFVSLPKGAVRAFLNRPSLSSFNMVPAVLLGSMVGYSMAGARWLGLHHPPKPI